MGTHGLAPPVMSGRQKRITPAENFASTPRTTAVALESAETGEMRKAAETPTTPMDDVTCRVTSFTANVASTPTTSVGSEPQAPSLQAPAPQPVIMVYASRTAAVDAVGTGNTTVNVPATTVTSVPKSSTAMAALLAVAL